MSLNVFDGTEQVYGLQRAILLYGDRHGLGFASLHDVDVDDAGRSEIRAGVPLTSEALRHINRSLSDNLRQKRFGFIPENVLINDDGLLVWFEPASRRNVYFNSTGPIGKRAGMAPHPGLIFALQGNRWFVFAFKQRGRPSPSTTLYHAPYFNVWESGQICVGSAETPRESILEQTTGWTEAFFSSNFSHTNHPRCVKYAGGAHSFWSDQLEGKFQRFPNQVLVPHPTQTLGQFYQSVSEN